MHDEQPQRPTEGDEPVTPTEPIVEEATTIPPQNHTPEPERIRIPCNCGMTYEFDVTPDTDSFTHLCQSCGTRTKWSR